MARDLVLRRKDLIENPTARVPICIVLDASGSMSEVVGGNPVRTGQTIVRDHQQWEIVSGGITRLSLLNDGLRNLISELANHEVAKYAAEIAVVSFAGKAETVVDFDSITNIESASISEMLNDGTNIGQGVDLALQLLDRRKQEYKDAGVDYFQPWLILMTDGRPTDSNYMISAEKVRQLVASRKLTVFAVGVGEQAGFDVLSEFTPKTPPLKLKGLRFTEFFEWLSKSIQDTAQTTPGEEIELDTDSMRSWGEPLGL
jgi:uncharacterized protein YegL